MELRSRQVGAWRLTWVAGALGDTPDLDAWFRLPNQPERLLKTLKDTHRTHARVFAGIDGAPVVYKRDLRKCRDPWIRLCTLVRDSEAMGHLKGLRALAAHGIAAPQPLLVAEHRRFGMVVDAWLLYRYREGVPVPRERNADIVGLLARLHDAGMYHRDVHIDNFLLDDDTVFLIDFKLRRNRLGAVAHYYDWICLERRHDSGIDASRFTPIDRASVAYRLALRYFLWKWPAHRPSLRDRT